MTRFTVSTRPFDPLVFWIFAGVTIGFVFWFIFFPDNMAAVINAVFNRTTSVWAWLYLVTVFSQVTGCFVLMKPNCGPIATALPLMFRLLALFGLFKGVNRYKKTEHA